VNWSRRALFAFALATALLTSLVGSVAALEVNGTTIPHNFGTHMACMGMGASGPYMPITGSVCVNQ
jgi:hypothetical protein